MGGAPEFTSGAEGGACRPHEKEGSCRKTEFWGKAVPQRLCRWGGGQSPPIRRKAYRRARSPMCRGLPARNRTWTTGFVDQCSESPPRQGEGAPGRNRTGHWSCLRNRCSATEHPRAETVRCARWQDRSWKRGLGRALRTMIWHRVFNEQGARLGAHHLASRSFPNSENPRRKSMGIERVLAAGSGWRSRTSVAGTKAQCPASRRPRNGS